MNTQSTLLCLCCDKQPPVGRNANATARRLQYCPACYREWLRRSFGPVQRDTTKGLQ